MPITYQPLPAGSNQGFSPAVTAGDFVYVSGQASVDEAGNIVHDTFENEMRRSFANVERILAAEGLTLKHVVKVCSFVAKQEDLAEYNRIYKELFVNPRPARTTLIECLGTVIKFEVDVVAYKGK